jgi:hypothetical protein
MREIYGRFTKSELGIMGWRSRETAHNMSASMRRHRASNKRGRESQSDYAIDTALSHLERRMGGVANKAETETGDIDLGRLTGPEALQYMRAMGLNMCGRA